MKSLKYHTKYLMLLVGILIAVVSPLAAEEQISVSDIKQQLSKAKAETAAAAPSPSELEQLRKSLLEAEEQILNEMAADKTSKTVSATEVIVVKGEDRIISKPQAVPAPKAEVKVVATEQPTNQAALDNLPANNGVVTASAKPAVQTSANFDQAVAALEGLRQTNSNLESKATKAQSRVAELERQLVETRNRLMIAEVEVERLSQILESRNKMTLARFDSNKQAAPTLDIKSIAQNPLAANVNTTQARQTINQPTHPVSLVSQTNREELASDDMPIATVTSAKANLRVGPTTNDSPLMTVSKGTRLVVEKRIKDWYRVITPNGTRAWVSADVVAFGPDSQSSPSRTVKIQGYRKETSSAK